jgi:hypothetical protein
VTAAPAFITLESPAVSGRIERLLRAGLTDFAAVIVGALVRLSALLPKSAADRTSFRLEAMWTITPAQRASLVAFVRNEKRDPDQRDAARNARRDHRGRPVSRTTG